MVLSAAGSFELGLTNGQHPDSSRLDRGRESSSDMGNSMGASGNGE